MRPEQAELVVWPGAGALPSLDPACLGSLAYPSLICRLTLIEDLSTVAIALAGLASGDDDSTRLTRLAVGSVSLLTGSRCPPYLQTTTSVQEPDDMTYGMTKATHITLTPDTAALVAFMHSELRPLVEYTAFAAPNNWYSVFRKVYAQASHFPLNIILPESIRRRAIQDLEARQFRIPIESEIQACDDRQTLSKQSDHAFSERVKALQAHRRAQRARIRSSFSDQAFLNRAATVFNVLNAALTKQRDSYYYAARQSTAADAVSCAYLSILLFDGLTKNSAASLLKSRYPRLVEHTERISKILFSRSPQALSRSEQSRL